GVSRPRASFWNWELIPGFAPGGLRRPTTHEAEATRNSRSFSRWRVASAVGNSLAYVIRNEHDNTENLQCQLPLWCHPLHVHLRGDHERPKMQLLHLHPQRGGHVLELLPPIGCRGG